MLTQDIELRRAQFKEIDIRRVDCIQFTNPDNAPFPGLLKVHFSENEVGSRVKNLTASFRLVSCWVDEFSKSPNVCKAYATIDPHRGKEFADARSLTKILSSSRHNHKRVLRDYFPMALQASQDGKMLIYCHDPDENPFYKTYKEGDQNRRNTPVFNSKALAVRACMEVIAEAIQVRVAGHKTIDFSKISDEVLIEIGFSEIKDRVGGMPSMWAGDPNHLILNSNVSYNPGYSSTSRNYSSYNRRDSKAVEMSKLLMEHIELQMS